MTVSIVLAPREFVTSPGIAVRLNASSSSDADEEILSFTWEFTQIPVGSRLVAADIASADLENDVVLFTPDQVGTYVVQLTVENESGEIATATATVMSQYAIGLTREPTTPDASYMFSVLPDFWKNVANNEVFSVLWSGYTQIVGTDLSRVYQNNDAKSLATVRGLYERRWLPYHPLYSLLDVPYSAIIGDVQGGPSARTTDDSQVASAVVISHQEIVLLNDVPSERAIGQQLEVTSGESIGFYKVLRINSDGSGYIVQRDSLSPEGDVVVSGTDLYGTRTSTTLTSPTTDFAAVVVAGDVLKLVAGADSGYYTIVSVESTHRVVVSTTLIRNRSGLTFSVLRPCSVTVDFPGTAYSTRVYLPATEADLTKYQAPTFSGTGSVRGAYEITVSPRHVFDAMVGKQVLITSGADGGSTFVISGVNASRDGYFLSAALSALVGTTVGYALSAPYAITDRLITIGGVTAPILAATLTESEWVVTVPDNIVPSGLSDATWYIGHVCSLTGVDIEEEGASVGDLLLLTARGTTTGHATEVSAAVLGTYANMVMFANGASMPTLSAGEAAVSAFTDAEQYKFFSELMVPTASYDTDTETVTLSRVAYETAQEMASLAFETYNFNLPRSAETVLTANVVTVQLSLVGLIRNTKIKVDDYLRSTPALFEYIRDPTVYLSEGVYTLVGRDSTVSEIARAPAVLQHNDEFVIDYDLPMKGTDAVVAAGFDTVTISDLDLVSMGIVPGDTLTLRHGATVTTYLICVVVDEATLRVRPTTGASTVFDYSASNLPYVVTRRNDFNYLRMLPDTFTSAVPAPRHLWAEISLFDNAPTIEANFGTLVGITKAELDAYGTSQDSYLTVVRGLAYGLTNGASLLNVSTAANLLLGAPVTPKMGIVYDVDNEFSASQGRITIQDISPEGVPQASYRSFLYALEGHAAPGFFGLADNPLTGTALTVGDVVLENQILSKAVAIADYVEDPNWWRRYGSLSGKELEKYHSWEVVGDLLQIPSEDLSLVTDFAMMARPVYTRPNVVGLLYLKDDVTVDDDHLSFEGTLLLFDDPAFSIESTHMIDDYDESSVPLRTLDVGSFGTRVLFRGRDLVTTGGASGHMTVTSARGGFVDPMTAAVNSYFPAVQTRGDGMVKAADEIARFPGDILRILTGPNTGVYEVTTVVNDTTLIVQQFGASYFASTGVEGPDPDEASAAVDQEFTVQRFNGPLIAYGTGAVTDGSSSLIATDGNFLTNNVAVGDVIVVVISGVSTEHMVLDVVRATVGTQDSVELVLDEEFLADDDVEYYVYREALLQNPIFSTLAAVLDGTATISITGGHVGGFLRAKDVVEILSGADEGKSFVIAGLPNSTDILVLLGADTLASETVELRVIRPSLDSAEDSDTALETLWVGEEATFDVMNPVTFYVPAGTITDGIVTVATREVTTASSFDFTDVTAGMKVQFSGTANSGVYVIESVSATTLTLTTPPSADESGVSLSIVTAASEFIVSVDGTVSTVSGYTFAGVGTPPLVASVMPGDIFEYDGNQVMISEVAASTFSLCQNPPPATGTYTGRVFRTRRT